jgi:hypothetical protein
VEAAAATRRAGWAGVDTQGSSDEKGCTGSEKLRTLKENTTLGAIDDEAVPRMRTVADLESGGRIGIPPAVAEIVEDV